MSNKGRLPALGLGAERPEQHARTGTFALSSPLSLALSLSLSRFLSLSLSLPPSLFLFSLGCPPLVSLVHSSHLPPVSPSV